LTNGDVPLNQFAQGVFSQPVIGYARGTVENYIAPPLLTFLSFATPGLLATPMPEITSLGLLKSAAQALPKLGGMTREAAKETLEKNGFKKAGMTKGGYEKWVHPDGSKVWIGPDGGIDKIPPGGGGYRVTPDGDLARPHTFPEEKVN
jgi:predicted RNA binding protein YcfA (HicA-like mRNA interferase family)